MHARPTQLCHSPSSPSQNPLLAPDHAPGRNSAWGQRDGNDICQAPEPAGKRLKLEQDRVLTPGRCPSPQHHWPWHSHQVQGFAMARACGTGTEKKDTLRTTKPLYIFQTTPNVLQTVCKGAFDREERAEMLWVCHCLSPPSSIHQGCGYAPAHKKRGKNHQLWSLLRLHPALMYAHRAQQHRICTSQFVDTHSQSPTASQRQPRNISSSQEMYFCWF